MGILYKYKSLVVFETRHAVCTPKVGYATALDVFIIICFVSVFTALIEFSFINFIDMFIRKGEDFPCKVTLQNSIQAPKM